MSNSVVNTAENIGKSYGDFVNTVTVEPGNALYDGIFDYALNPVLSAVGLGGGTTSTKVMRNDRAKTGGNVTELSKGQYNNVKAFQDWYNGWKTDDEDLNALWSGTYAVKKDSPYKKAKTKYYNQYGAYNNTGNSYLDAFLTSGSGDFNNYLNKQMSDYQKNYQNKADSLLKDYTSQYLNDIYNSKVDNVNSTNQSLYDEAAATIDRQLKRGYLSDSGYNKAIQELQSQMGLNAQALTGAYDSQVGTWEDGLSQAWAKDLLDSSKLNDEYTWLGGINENTWADPIKGITNYGDSYIANGGIDALTQAMKAVNTFNPDTYIAKGAEAQGQYNPFDINAVNNNKKKKKDELSVGAF